MNGGDDTHCAFLLPDFLSYARCRSALRVARLERDDFRMKRSEDSVSLAIGSNGSDRNLLISEMSKSVQNSSVRACIPGVNLSVEIV